MVNATIAGETYVLVIDTGSADTWVAASTFTCETPYSQQFSDQNADCGFGHLYNARSKSFEAIDYPYKVNYSGGEYLRGEMGVEDFGFGDKDTGEVVSVRQVIGVVDRGFWMGDGISSGLMGLGFSALARGVNKGGLEYSSVFYTL